MPETDNSIKIDREDLQKIKTLIRLTSVEVAGKEVKSTATDETFILVPLTPGDLQFLIRFLNK